MSAVRLLVCFVGINACYLYYGVVQESLSRPDKNGEKLNNTLFLFGAQALMNALVGLAFRLAVGGSRQAKPLTEPARTVPVLGGSVPGWVWLTIVSSSYLMAMLASHQALMYVSYPLQALAKSSKMLPVMVGTMLVGEPLKPREVVMLLSVTAGILIFQWEAKPSSNSTWTGYALLGISLTLDGFTGSHQRLFDKEFKLSTHGLMFAMNAISFAMLLVLLVVTGDGLRGVEFVSTHPDTAWLVLKFALASAAGQNFIFYCITGPGPLVCTFITTTRKFFTVLLSSALFSDNRFTMQQWLGVFLVFASITAELGEKFFEHRRPHAHADGGKKLDGDKPAAAAAAAVANGDAHKKE